jgi:hypothetical protein
MHWDCENDIKDAERKRPEPVFSSWVTWWNKSIVFRSGYFEKAGTHLDD